MIGISAQMLWGTEMFSFLPMKLITNLPPSIPITYPTPNDLCFTSVPALTLLVSTSITDFFLTGATGVGGTYDGL